MIKKALIVVSLILFSAVSVAQFDVNDNRQYRVVINHEEQYSIWPADRELPLGWNGVGKIGTKQECLEYIEQVWTDMKPLSLQKLMEAEAKTKRKPDE